MTKEKKLEKLKNEILDMERENLSKIDHVDDKQTVLKIIKMYEELEKNDN